MRRRYYRGFGEQSASEVQKIQEAGGKCVVFKRPAKGEKAYSADEREKKHSVCFRVRGKKDTGTTYNPKTFKRKGNKKALKMGCERMKGNIKYSEAKKSKLRAACKELGVKI